MTSARRFGLGLAALGRPAYINVGRAVELPAARTVESMRSTSWEVLDAAYEAGIRWMDTARSYGRAEEFLAGWLADRGHRDVTVSSKWGYEYVGAWRMNAREHEVKEHTEARLRTQLAETRGLLGDRLALYQVHSLNADSPLFEDPGLVAALAETAASGLSLGFSTTGPRQADTVRRALGLEADGRRLFTSVQSTWNLLEPSAGEALREAHDEGLHVLVKATLANGRLASKPPPAFAEMAARRGVGMDSLAIAAVLGRAWADTVLLGPVSVAQLHTNLSAADLELGDEDLSGLSMQAERYWAERAALSWT